MVIFYIVFIYTYFIYSWVSRLFQVNFIRFIVYSQIVRTSQFLDSVTNIVLDVDREIVLLDDFLYQNICAVPLESIILPIKSDIMWISPTVTFACKTKTSIYFHLNWNIINLVFTGCAMKTIKKQTNNRSYSHSHS